MSRIKFFFGTILSVLTYFVITSSAFHSDSSASNGLHQNPKTIKVDSKKIVLYNSKKKELQRAFDAYFSKQLKQNLIIGAGVTIVKSDSIVVTSGYGKRDAANNKDVNSETVFRLGSLSKGFTGVLVANLIEEGKLQWKDRVVDYIPEFKFGTENNTNKIQIAHLLSHTAGTAYHSYTNLIEAGLSMESIAPQFNQLKPISAPGTTYSYQNAMFSLSQEVLYKVTGKRIQTLLEDTFFKPLEMTSVSMNHKELLAYENVAIPYSKRRNGWKKLSLRDNYYNAIAAGGINASPIDMGRWMRFLLGHNPEVMKHEAIEDAFTPFISFNNKSKYYQRWEGHLQSAYGYGWRIHKFENKETNNVETMYHHGGSVNSFRNEIALFPEDDLGICVLLNSNSKLARNVIPDLKRIYESVYTETTLN
jgi:beta-lactamase class C